MEINKVSLNNFREDFDKAMETLKEKYGVNIKLGVMNHDGSSQFYAKVEVKNQMINGVSFKQAEWNKYHKLFDLKPEWFGKIVFINQKQFKIIGISPSKKNSIEIESTDNKKYSCSPSSVIKHFNSIEHF